MFITYVKDFSEFSFDCPISLSQVSDQMFFVCQQPRSQVVVSSLKLRANAGVARTVHNGGSCYGVVASSLLGSLRLPCAKQVRFSLFFVIHCV